MLFLRVDVIPPRQHLSAQGKKPCIYTNKFIEMNGMPGFRKYIIQYKITTATETETTTKTQHNIWRMATKRHTVARVCTLTDLLLIQNVNIAIKKFCRARSHVANICVLCMWNEVTVS